MQSKATTVDAYLASLPEDRRAALSALRAVFLKNLDKDYREGMQYGMIGYFVPHEVFPPGYHCDPRQPLPFAGMASQKGHLSLYMMCTYSHAGTKSWFEQAWRATGKKLDMGKACVRFKRIEDVPLEVVGEAIRRMPAKKWIEIYTQSLAAMGRGVDGKPLKKGGGGKAEGGSVKKATKKAGAARPAKKVKKKARTAKRKG
ncbi:MAG TPA: DUF1801 domain-containing protein [Phycisphaerales bacterium]|nr:DUF1801 domain-containing protein [Phycisphaerales bacterium]